MYAIGYVVYGLPLRNASCRSEDIEWSEELELAFDGFDPGFITPYSGAQEQPAAFGVQIDCFDEACHHIDLTDLTLVPTNKQRAAYLELFSNLSPTLQEELSAERYGLPRVFILWGTS